MNSTAASSGRIETLACDFAPRMPISADGDRVQRRRVTRDVAELADLGQAARWIEPGLPPRPDLLGHEGQERREQPQLDVEREGERRLGGLGAAGPPASSYARSLTSST